MKTPNEHCGIFFKTDRFTQLAGGHFWLSEKPDIPESKSWDSSLPRMATWVLLNDKTDEAAPAILFVNTHFDHRGAQARAEAAKLIRQKITQLRAIADDPVTVVTGDFNTAEASEPYKAFLHENKDLVDTYRVRHPERGENEGTFGGFRGNTAGSRIDWILASPQLEVVEAEIDRTEEDGRFPSDHYPVTAVLNRK
jgi:endonuclease/exonuclease/phosphatase family metal-dependent hydrolase